MSSAITIDREFAALIPPLLREEREQLKQSIQKEGCRDPLVISPFEGKRILLDGHNRLEICRRLKKPFKLIELKFASREAARVWVIRNQLARRNLSEDMRAVMALQVYKIQAAGSLKRRAAHAAAVRWSNERAHGATGETTREEISKLSGISLRKIRDMVEIDKHDGSKQLITQIKAGEITRREARRRLHHDAAHHLVRRGEINIGRETLKWMRQNLQQHEIKRLIARAIERYRIPPPLSSLSESDARCAFEQLRAMDTRALFRHGKFFLRHEYKLKPKSWTYVALSPIGSAASNYFHQTSRFNTHHARFASPATVWRDARQLDATLEALFSLDVERVDSAQLRKVISLRRYMASQFRPSAAKAVYDYFASARVLDFSAGWGDRLAGFCASNHTREYLGCDPNRGLQRAYAAQTKLYGRSKKIKVLPLAAEDCEFPKNYFDLCFTSPPYFTNERYSEDEGQSAKRYGDSIDTWLEGFLFRALERAFRALKPGGFLAINLSDVWMHGGVIKLVDPMNDFIRTKLKASFFDCWGLAMPKRPASAAAKTGVFAEPIWLWRHGDD
jgi:hypothetical protein